MDSYCKKSQVKAVNPKIIGGDDERRRFQLSEEPGHIVIAFGANFLMSASDCRSSLRSFD